jgi:hypothetical protein
MVIGRFSQRDMREVNVSSIRTYRQIRAPATNRRKRKSAMFRNKRQLAPPVKTGLMSKVKTLFRTKRQPAPPAKTGLMSKVKTLFRTKRQPAPPARTGLMSKVKALFSSRKEMTKPTPKAKKPGRRK